MNSDTLLLRQAHPNFVRDGLVTSQAFIPFPKHHGLLSVYDGDKITARDSYIHFTKQQGLASQSTWAVTKHEADEVGVPGKPDPLPGNPAHAALNFSKQPDRVWRKLAKRLKAKAIERGCLYMPDE